MAKYTKDTICLDEDKVAVTIQSEADIEKPKDGLSEIIAIEMNNNVSSQFKEEENNELNNENFESVIDDSVEESSDKIEENNDNYENNEKEFEDEINKESDFFSESENHIAILRGKKEDIEITSDNFVIGKSSDCSYVLDERYISREHCKITVINNKYFIEDLESTNGTKVDGKKIHTKTELINGQIVTLADRRYEFWVD